MERKKVRIPLRTSGSPPVMRSFFTPRPMNAVAIRSSSSRLNSSCFGRKVISSAMQ